VEEKRSIARKGALSQQALQLLDELGSGSKQGQLAVLPAQAKATELFITKTGTAFVNYNRALVELHGGGVEAELATVYAIVNTLTHNFPEITAVRILVDGAEVQTLGGHLDLSSDLKQDISLVRGHEQSPIQVRVEPLPP
jgi:hypothetical protein